jgi:hypothetical protein
MIELWKSLVLLVMGMKNKALIFKFGFYTHFLFFHSSFCVHACVCLFVEEWVFISQLFLFFIF